MKTCEFWRETATGEVWAVELEDGVAVGSKGPLHWTEINPAFLHAGYDYDPAEASGIEVRREEFVPLEEAEIVTIIGSAD